MLNRKGQGLTEYGIILLLVVLIGSGVWFSGGIGNNVQAMYSTIRSDLKSIIGEDDGSIYETGIIKNAFTRNGDGQYKKIDAHLTNIKINGHTLYWCEGGNGSKIYDFITDTKKSVAKNLRYPTDQHNPAGNIRTIYFEDGSRGGFFKADNGYIYQVSVSGTGENISDVSVVPYTGNPNAIVTSKIDGKSFTVENAAEITTKSYFK